MHYILTVHTLCGVEGYIMQLCQVTFTELQCHSQTKELAHQLSQLINIPTIQPQMQIHHLKGNCNTTAVSN